MVYAKNIILGIFPSKQNKDCEIDKYLENYTCTKRFVDNLVTTCDANLDTS